MMEEWIVVLAVESVFLVFAIGAAWAVMSWRMKNLESIVYRHIDESISIKEDITKTKIWVGILLEKNGAKVEEIK